MPGPARISWQTPLRQGPSRQPVAARRELGTAAMAAARTKDATYLGARYQRLAHRLGKKKAIVALQHSILIAAWHMLANDVDHQDLGGDYFARRDPELAMRRIVRQANTLGFTVRFDPIQA